VVPNCVERSKVDPASVIESFLEFAEKEVRLLDSHL